MRIVHLGLGNFVRAHLAWYTHHAPDGADWGIAAFTGRRPDAARALAPQDGLYTLIIRGAEHDELEIITSLSAVHAASDHTALLDYFRNSEVVIVTLTVTEAGYRRSPDGGLSTSDPEVVTDIVTLTQDPTAAVRTAPARVVAGLMARQVADAGPITVLPCDNLPDNGAVTSRVVRDMAAQVDPALGDWIAENVEFAASMVDRITPGSTAAEQETVREALGAEDVAPVVTEPFSEWVISGAFSAGRPQWDAAGASIVADIEPYEQRKLLLLNGAHSLMAYAGSALGHETVAEAIADPRCRAWVEQLWHEAEACLTVPAEELAAYRAALVERFTNPRMGDRLARIAADGSQKIPVRILPVLRAARDAGRVPPGAVAALAGWIAHLRGTGAPLNDPAAAIWRERATGEPSVAASNVIAALTPELADDTELYAAVAAQLAALETR